MSAGRSRLLLEAASLTFIVAGSIGARPDKNRRSPRTRSAFWKISTPGRGVDPAPTVTCPGRTAPFHRRVAQAAATGLITRSPSNLPVARTRAKRARAWGHPEPRGRPPRPRRAPSPHRDRRRAARGRDPGLAPRDQGAVRARADEAPRGRPLDRAGGARTGWRCRVWLRSGTARAAFGAGADPANVSDRYDHRRARARGHARLHRGAADHRGRGRAARRERRTDEDLANQVAALAEQERRQVGEMKPLIDLAAGFNVVLAEAAHNEVLRAMVQSFVSLMVERASRIYRSRASRSGISRSTAASSRRSETRTRSSPASGCASHRGARAILRRPAPPDS